MPTLYHYTSENGLTGILATQVLWPSLFTENPNDARYGDGQYLSDISPGTKSPGQLAYLFLNDPRGWRRFTHFLEIDVIGLDPIEGRSGVFVIRNDKVLLLTNRIVSRSEPMIESEDVDMQYSELNWRHDSLTEPTRILSEHDANGWERRKVEIFADGSVAFASAAEAVGGAKLSEIRCPPDGDVLSSEMSIIAITAAEFEREWDSARRAAAIHS